MEAKTEIYRNLATVEQILRLYQNETERLMSTHEHYNEIQQLLYQAQQKMSKALKMIH